MIFDSKTSVYQKGFSGNGWWSSHLENFEGNSNQIWKDWKSEIPSGKPTKNYGQSPCYSWVNQLFRLGHGFKFANCKRLPEGLSRGEQKCGVGVLIHLTPPIWRFLESWGYPNSWMVLGQIPSFEMDGQGSPRLTKHDATETTISTMVFHRRWTRRDANLSHALSRNGE